MRRIAVTVLVFCLAVAAILAMEVRQAAHYESPNDHFQNPTHEIVSLKGPPGPAISYLVMGDSTAAGRGAAYDKGIAMESARHLQKQRSVNMMNIGVSGAKLADVERDQLPIAKTFKPDVLLISAGANDVTNFTPNEKVERSLHTVLEELQRTNPNIRIVVAGSGDLGPSRRFAIPLNWIARSETARVNRVMQMVAGRHHVQWVDLAHETGPFFEKDGTLYAADRFHPNERGYATWLPFLHSGLDSALLHR